MSKCFKLNGGIRNRRTVPSLRSQSAVSVNSASILLSTRLTRPATSKTTLGKTTQSVIWQVTCIWC